MLEWAINLYTEALPQVQGAIISGLITAATATVGVLVVVMQLRGQAKNAIASNRHNEAIKLKKEIYGIIEPIFREAAMSQSASNVYPRITLDTFRIASAFYLEREDQVAFSRTPSWSRNSRLRQERERRGVELQDHTQNSLQSEAW
ncbi:MAG TPA: hypothetical protein VGJ56_00780 [Reyranella sp.]|jgi:hypothetical protein